MNSKIILAVYDTVTFPVAFLGYLWYFFIETPLFVGRTRANEMLASVVHEADEGEE